MPQAQRDFVLEQSFDVIASNLLNLARIKKYSPDYLKSHSNIDELKKYSDAMRIEGRGILWVSAHYGQFELLMPFKGYFCSGGAGIARPFGIDLLDRVWRNRREVSGSKILTRSGAFNETVKLLSAGTDVALLFDQNVKKNHAVFSKLFGIPAATARSAGLAFVRTGSPVLFSTLECTTALGSAPQFSFHFKQIQTSDLAGLEADFQVQTIIDRLNLAIEEAICRDPKQWFWIHRRFKTRPEGEVENFYLQNGGPGEPTEDAGDNDLAEAAMPKS